MVTHNTNNSKDITVLLKNLGTFLEVCLSMPYLQRVNNGLLLGEDGQQRLRQRGNEFGLTLTL